MDNWVLVALQTSFLTPPVGFALFYLKGVCPADVRLAEIYSGGGAFHHSAAHRAVAGGAVSGTGDLAAGDRLSVNQDGEN